MATAMAEKSKFERIFGQLPPVTLMPPEGPGDSERVFSPPPLYTIYEGDMWPAQVLNEKSFYVCPHCRIEDERPMRACFWVDEKEQVEHAGLICRHCRKLGCYMEVILAGHPAYLTRERMLQSGRLTGGGSLTAPRIDLEYFASDTALVYTGSHIKAIKL